MWKALYDNIKIDFVELQQYVACRLDLSGSRYGPVAACVEYRKCTPPGTSVEFSGSYGLRSSQEGLCSVELAFCSSLA